MHKLQIVLFSQAANQISMLLVLNIGLFVSQPEVKVLKGIEVNGVLGLENICQVTYALFYITGVPHSTLS